METKQIKYKVLILSLLTILLYFGNSCAELNPLENSESEDNSALALLALAGAANSSSSSSSVNSDGDSTTTETGADAIYLARANLGLATWGIGLEQNVTASSRTNGGSSFAHSPANWIAVSEPGCGVTGVDGFISSCGIGTEGVIGVCHVRFIISSGQIVDSTLVMLKSFQDGGDTEADKQSVFTHEIGHCLGLEHSNSQADIMYFNTSGADEPSTAELNAVTAAYDPVAEPTGANAARYGTTNGEPTRQFFLPRFHISSTIGNALVNAPPRGQAITGPIAEVTHYFKADGTCESEVHD